MEEWQRNVVTSKLWDLLDNTEVNVTLLAKLSSAGLLAKQDEQAINAGSTPLEKSKKLYEIVMTRTTGYPVLTKALHDTSQTGATFILLNGYLENGVLKPLKLCGITVDYESILDANVELYGETVKMKHIFGGISVDALKKIMDGGIPDNEVIKHFIFKKEKLVIFPDSIPCPPRLYIPRSISNRFRLYEYVFKKEFEDVFVFKGLDRIELTELVSPRPTSLSSKQLHELTCQFILLKHKNDWNEIRNLAVQNARPVHLIQCEKGSEDDSRPTYILLDSSGHSSMLWQYTENHSKLQKAYISEDEFINYIDSAHCSGFCICDSPGMGKSWLLANLARKLHQKHPARIVLFHALSKLNHHMDIPTQSMDYQQAISYLFGKLTSSALSTAILNEVIQDKRVPLDLFLDGLDEVPSIHLDWTKQFLMALVNGPKNVRIYVTSRAHLRSELEKSLGVIAYDILPFSQENQQNFLVQYWKHHISKWDESKLKRFAMICIRSLSATIHRSDRKAMSFPLQCLMIAEVYTREAALYSDPEREIDLELTRTSTSLYQMYKSFIEGRLNCSNASDGFSQQSETCLKKKIKSYHGGRAFETLFRITTGDFAVTKLEFNQESTKMALFSPGLLEEQNDYGHKTIEFFHRTMAEFLVAEQIGDELFQSDIGDNDASEDIIQCFSKHVFHGSPGMMYLNGAMHLIYDDCAFPVVLNFFNERLKNEASFDIAEQAKTFFLDSLTPHRIHEILTCSIGHGRLYVFRFIKHLLGTLDDRAQRKYKKFFFGGANNQEDIAYYFLHSPSYLLLCMAATHHSVPMMNECFQLLENCFQYDVSQGMQAIPQGWETPLHGAVRNADYDMVEYLLNRYAPQNSSLLSWCIAGTYWRSDEVVKRRIQIFELLLRKCYPGIDRVENVPFRSLIDPDVSPDVHLDILKLLAKKGVNFLLCSWDPTRDFTVVHLASVYMSPDDFGELCRFLMQGCQKSSLFNPHLPTYPSTIHHILNYQKLNVTTAKLILGIPGIDVNHIDNLEDICLLALAIKGGNDIDVIEELVRCGARVDFQDESGNSLLHLAAEMGRVKILEYPISIGLSPKSRGYQDKTSLYEAIDHLDILSCLLLKGVYLYAKNRKGNNVAHICAYQHYNPKFHQAATLLYTHDKRGCLFTDRNNSGQTPVQIRVLDHMDYTSDESLAFLLGIPGVDVSGTGSNSCNAFLLAVAGNKTVDNLKMLVRLGCDPYARNSVGENALHIAVSRSIFSRLTTARINIVKYLLSLGRYIYMVNIYGSNPHKEAVSNLAFYRERQHLYAEEFEFMSAVVDLLDHAMGTQ